MLLIYLALNLVVGVLIVRALLTVSRYLLETSTRASVNNLVMALLLCPCLLISPNLIAHGVFYALSAHLSASDTVRPHQTPPYRPKIVELVQKPSNRDTRGILRVDSFVMRSAKQFLPAISPTTSA